ncbi:MAG: serine/threonine protein kinase [Chloroflexi bacterium]|nr:MAG: serine/threonine protein kinase [Chloroflexota bacterium]
MELFTTVGTTLEGPNGRYRVIKEVARGGMGAVYRAEDLTHQRYVAIKEACLDPVACEGKRDQIRARLLHEMRILKPLSHPCIPRIFDQFSSHNNEYLVMEFIEGQTLMQIQQRTLRQKRLLEEPRVLGWLIQVLDALDYLHTRPQPIIHRDIKPENLILTPDGRVMLVDFGLMKQVEEQLSETGPLTEATGTVEYAPPEQYAQSGASTDARSDIYSLGATFYYLLAGRLPPRSVDRMMPLSIDVTRKPPSLRKINPTVSARTEQVIFKALEVDPEHRYQSAAQMRRALLPPRRFILLPF